MFEGKYVRWGIGAADGELAGKAYVELRQPTYTTTEMLEMIQELMAVRDRLGASTYGSAPALAPP